MKLPMRLFLRGGLRVRLLGLVAMALAPALALIVVMNIEDRREKTASAYDDAARIVRLAVARQAEQVDRAFHVLNMAARAPEIWSGDPERCAAVMRGLMLTNRGQTNIAIAAPDGRLLCSAVTPREPMSFADRPWFQEVVTSRQRVVSAVARGRFSNSRPVLVAALPIVDEAGVQAVAFAGLDPASWMSGFVRDAERGSDVSVKVLDARGTILVREPHPDRWTLRDASAVPHIRTIMANVQGTTEGTGLDGIRRLYAFAPLLPAEPTARVHVAIGIPVAEAFAPANRALVRNLSWLAIAAVVTFAAAWSGGTALVLNGVRRLVAAAERIGRGDLTARVQLSANHGEISQLAQAFDDMASGLQRREAALEAAAAARRQAELRVQWATIAETSRDAILGMNEDGTVFSWNAGAESLFGYSAREVIGRPALELLPPERGAEATALFRHARRGGRVNDVEMPIVANDGRRTAMSWTLSPIHDPAGTVVGISAIARDITERRAAEAQMRVQSAALEAAANGILIADVDGRIEWVNAAFTAMTGYEADEVVGQNTRILKSGRHDDAFYAELWRTVTSGRVWRGRLVNRRRDGTCYDEEETITPVRTADGRIGRFVAIKQDVTDQRHAEDALRRSEEHFRSLIENALDMIVITDADGVTTYASPSVERVTGLRPEEVVGDSAFRWIHRDDLAAARAAFDDVARRPGAAATSVQYRLRHRDRSWRTLESVGRSVVEEPGVLRVIVNARDVTERVEADAARRRLQAQLAQTEKLAAMGNLLAGVAHELNNPLAVVIGHATLLRDSTRGTDGAARAAKIHDSAQRCARIVRNFLALARQHEPERTSVDLRQLVRDTLEMMAYPLRVDAVEIVLDLADDVPAVAVDAHQIQQVLVNLVTNAHHAMLEVSTPRRLTIGLRLDATAHTVELAVGDTGPGIDPALQRRLFEPFFTTKPIGQGTGLGLSICKGIVEGHGGHIEVSTIPGCGATFTVALPAHTATLPPPAEEAAPALAPRRLLVVDDEPEMVSLLAEILRNVGHTVDSAVDGHEALAKIEGGSYDAIVSDIKMPGLDGPALYRTVVGRRPELADRFVFVTGDTLSESTTEFLAKTNAVSVAKPFNVAAVRRALASVTAGQASVGTIPAAIA